MEPRAVVQRELEGLWFPALVLRAHDSARTADLMYVDDCNIEREVPYADLRPVTDSAVASSYRTDEILERWRQRIDEIRSEEAELIRGAAACGGKPPLFSTVAEVEAGEDGKVVLADGSTIYCHGDVADADGDSSTRSRSRCTVDSRASTAATTSSNDENQWAGNATIGAVAPTPPKRAAECPEETQVAKASAAGGGLRGIRHLRGYADGRSLSGESDIGRL